MVRAHPNTNFPLSKRQLQSDFWAVLFVVAVFNSLSLVMKNYATFEQAQKLHEKGFFFGEPTFGDVFYIIHPDTGNIDNVVVGSAKWHLSALLPMYRAPSLQDLMENIGDDYAIRYEKKRAYWTIEKTKSVDFSVQEVDFIVNSFPIGYGENPITLIVNLICG